MRAPLLLLLAAAIPAAAQMPPGKWWKDRAMTERIGLGRDQEERIDAIFASERDRLIDLRAEAEKRQARLEDEFDAPEFDEVRARERMQELEAARSELVRAELAIQIRIRAVLTHAQYLDLRKQLPRQPPAPRPPAPPHPPRGPAPPPPTRPGGDGPK